MIPDPKWLEILQASGWQTTALAAAFGVLLLVIHVGWIASPDPWFTALYALAFLICIFLALASICHAVVDFLQPRTWLTRRTMEKKEQKSTREYIPFMTNHEQTIIAYLLHCNQKTFNAAPDGGNARTLISRRIVVVKRSPMQLFMSVDWPFVVPDHVWDVLVQHKARFPYTPIKLRDGVEQSPWREYQEGR